MGYYTEYSLTARKVRNQTQFEEIHEELRKRDLIGYAFDSGTYDDKNHEAVFGCYDSAKWYEHSKDMIMIAEKFPNVYFELEGEGEEYGDFWREYYHDMDIEFCRGEIIFEQPKKVQWKDLIPF